VTVGHLKVDVLCRDREALEGFMSMDMDTLRHGLRGMQDAIERDSSIAHADCALPFAIRILQELIAVRSASPGTVQFKHVSSSSSGCDAKGVRDAIITIKTEQQQQDDDWANKSEPKKQSSREDSFGPAAEPQAGLQSGTSDSPNLGVDRSRSRARSPLALTEESAVASHQLQQMVSAAPSSPTLRGAAAATAANATNEDGATGDTCPVTSWLQSAGLEEHASKFAAERIDMLSLGMLNETDLRDLGLPLGHRRRFQAYVEMMTG
jgi:hypothetical protein